MTKFQTASALLERSEKEPDFTLRLSLFSEAIGMLDSPARQPGISPNDLDSIRKLKLVHTRALLRAVPELSDYAKLDDWLAVQWVFKKIQPQLEIVTREDAGLKVLYEKFMGIWEKEPLKAGG